MSLPDFSEHVLIEAILTNYSPSLSKDIKLRKFQNQGYVNEIYEVYVGDATQNDSPDFILKIYNTQITNLSNTKRSLLAAKVFKEHITPLAVSALENKHGKLLSCFKYRNNTYYFALFPYVKHKRYKDRDVPEQGIFNIAQFIAKMHNRYVDKKPDVDKVFKNSPYYKESRIYFKLNRNLGIFRQKLHDLKAKTYKIWPELTDYLQKSFNFAQNMLKKYKDLIDMPHEKYLSHRDTTSDNILLDENNKVVGLIDFERAIYMNFYREFWFFLLYSVIAPKRLAPGHALVKEVFAVYKKYLDFPIDRQLFENAKIIELVYWFTKPWAVEGFLENPERYKPLIEANMFMLKNAEEVLKLRLG